MSLSSGAASGVRGALTGAVDALKTLFRTTNTERRENPLRAHYDALEHAYLSGGTYEDLRRGAQASTTDGLAPLRSLRNPAHRVVEFYSNKLVISEWLEAIKLPEPEAPEGADGAVDEAGDEPLPEPVAPSASLEPQEPQQHANLKARIADLHRWSNLDAEGRPTVRRFAMFGDLFWKVSHRESDEGEPLSVYYEQIDPRNVMDFDKDERGFFTWLRIDTPKTRRLDNGELEPYMLTEVWSKESATYEFYEHDKPQGHPLDQLPPPADTVTLDEVPAGAANPADYTGFDFIPVVHRKFRDVGASRGLASFAHALWGIREADKIATKLHEMLFPDEVWVLERQGVGPDGNPLPAIELEDDPDNPPSYARNLPDGQGWARGYPYSGVEGADGTVSVGRSRVVRLPSGGKLEPKIPNRNLAPQAEALARQVAWNEQELPETSYYRLRDMDLSGVAMRTALMDVIDRATEAATNLAGALAQADEMGLTIAQVLGLPGFSPEEIGTYEARSFEHTYPVPELFPETPKEKAEGARAEGEALKSYKEVGLLEEGLEKLGFEDAALTAEKAQANTPDGGSASRLLFEDTLTGGG